jgi:hypothetical protein
VAAIEITDMMNLSRILRLAIPWVFRQNGGLVSGYQFRCLIQGEDNPFLLTLADSEIGDLKKKIYKECDQDVFGKTLPRNLVIVKVGMP